MTEWVAPTCERLPNLVGWCPSWRQPSSTAPSPIGGEPMDSSKPRSYAHG